MVLSMVSTICAQTLTNKPIFETESLKVVVNGGFRTNLNCEIFVGTNRVPYPNGSPYFSAEGTSNQLEVVDFEFVGSGPVVGAIRKKDGTNSYILHLFTEDVERKVVSFFDLNFDGTWDVKKTPTRSPKNFILFQGQWLVVDEIDGLLSRRPTAKQGDKKYVFLEMWKLSD